MGPRFLVVVLGILPYTDPDLYGGMTVTDGSLRAAVRCICGICILFAENQ